MTMKPLSGSSLFGFRQQTAGRLLFAIAAAALLAGSLGAGPALAQSGDMSSLTNRLSRLENEIQTLSRQVYRGEAPSSSGGAGGGGAGGAPLPGNLAGDFEIRLSRMERDVQVLTGKYEEAVYGITQLRERLEKLNGDLDFRFQQLESRQTGAAGNGAAKPGNEPAPSSPVAAPGKDKGKPGPSAGEGAQGAALPSGANAQEKYDHAFGLLRQADYVRAEQAFTAFLSQHKDHALAGNAQYWLAETFYVRGKYNEAAIAFAEGFQRYPKSAKAGDNLLKLALSLAQLKKKDEACLTLGQLGTRLPDAPAAVKRRADQERKNLGCP